MVDPDREPITKITKLITYKNNMTALLNARILASLGMIVFVAAVVASSTGAFFSDTETSTGNTFTAGALDLLVDSVAHVNGLVCYQGDWAAESAVQWDPVDAQLEVVGDIAAANAAYNAANPSNVPQAGDDCVGTWAMTNLGPEHTFFDFGDLKPGDNGENTVSIHVENNDAFLCAAIHDVVSADNTCTEPEDGEAGELCTVSVPENAVNGELDQELNFMVWEDDGDNVLEDGEDVLVENASGENIAGVYPLFTPSTGAMTGGATAYLGVAWCYGEFSGGVCTGTGVTNISQTDSLTADVTFYVEQARNNGQFQCPALSVFDPQV